MSRVFTCPPVLIARNQASRQNLVDSTKLGRITLDSKKTHSLEKRERKEKRKLKKEAKGEKSHKHSSRKKASDDKKQFLSPKKVSFESDLLEKSSVTEDLEEPQNHLGYLSDGSHNSRKRKRENSPPAVDSPIPIKASSVSGNPLKIRLILKPKLDVPALPQKEVVCPTITHQDVITKPEESLPSTSAIAETKKIKKHRPSKEDRYNALFDDWTPPSLSFVEDLSSKDDGDDWLFGNKTQRMLNPKAPVKIDEGMNMRLGGGDSSWPRAQFLPEVGIYSLPFTVPF